MLFNLNYKEISELICHSVPYAKAQIKGGGEYPDINGTVNFYNTPFGVVVMADIKNLPTTQTNIHGLHIHEGESCGGTAEMPFADSLEHYNPGGQPHPRHAGDLPPLFANNGYAWMAVLTNRFFINEVLGRTVIIHSNPDDFTTQPSGNSGTKIACGIIQKINY